VTLQILLNDTYKLNHCKEMGAEPGRRFLKQPAEKLKAVFVTTVYSAKDFLHTFGIMEKHMRPPLLDADANSPDGPRNWRHWKRCFQSYIQRIEGVTDADKFDI